MLQVDLRELAQGPVETRADVPRDDPLFAGLDIVLAAPVRVDGRLQATGEGRFYWHGSLETELVGGCRRCLAPVTLPVRAEIGALFTQDPDVSDDPDSYPAARDTTHVDLRPAVREELALVAPRFP